MVDLETPANQVAQNLNMRIFPLVDFERRDWGYALRSPWTAECNWKVTWVADITAEFKPRTVGVRVGDVEVTATGYIAGLDGSRSGSMTIRGPEGGMVTGGAFPLGPGGFQVYQAERRGQVYFAFALGRKSAVVRYDRADGIGPISVVSDTGGMRVAGISARCVE